MDTKIRYDRPFPQETEYGKWKHIAEKMEVGGSFTLNNRNQMMALANALRKVGKVPRTNLKSLTVFRRL